MKGTPQPNFLLFFSAPIASTTFVMDRTTYIRSMVTFVSSREQCLSSPRGPSPDWPWLDVAPNGVTPCVVSLVIFESRLFVNFAFRVHISGLQGTLLVPNVPSQSDFSREPGIRTQSLFPLWTLEFKLPRSGQYMISYQYQYWSNGNPLVHRRSIPLTLGSQNLYVLPLLKAVIRN